MKNTSKQNETPAEVAIFPVAAAAADDGGDDDDDENNDCPLYKCLLREKGTIEASKTTEE
jgi:hypothetical protein